MTYEIARYQQFADDMDEELIEHEEYQGRSFYVGPAVRAEPPREEGGAAGEALEAAFEAWWQAGPVLAGSIYDDAQVENVAHAAFKAGAAARAPGPVGGEAWMLEALKGIEAEADRWLHDEAPAHEVIVNIGKRAAALLAERTLAAARAPGLVGGEADRARLVRALKRLFSEIDEWIQEEFVILDEDYFVEERALLAELETPAAAAPVEPGGEA